MRRSLRFSFGDEVRALCEKCYSTDPSRGGRPGIDPEVYVKMLLVGYLEGIPSERGIATRCADSLAIRAFLGFDLSERTPHHSSLTVIRQRLDEQTFKAIFGLIFKALSAHNLIKGKRIGIDTSVMEANTSMKSLHHRMTGESYWNYVRKLAAGIDPDDFDADILPGDQHDTDELAARIFTAEDHINAALGNEPDTALFTSVTADKGYFKVSEIVELRHEEVATRDQ